MECQVNKRSSFKWNTLFQEFQNMEFQVLLQDHPSTYLSKGIYKNISKFCLHQEVAKTPVFPCSDAIEWMTWRIDHESKTILNLEEKHVANY